VTVQALVLIWKLLADTALQIETCLLELARRGCDENNCKHESDNVEYSPEISTAGLRSQPCERHMSETKSRYGGILDNLGCICKVLLSLNIEPCCVIPSHASIRSQRAQQAERSEASSTTSRRPKSAHKASQSLDAPGSDRCGGNSLGRSGDLSKPATGIKINVLPLSCESQGCCGKQAFDPVRDDDIAEIKDLSDDDCCGGTVKGELPDYSGISCDQGCCGSQEPESAAKVNAIDGDQCDRDDCCQEEEKFQTQATKDSPKGCSSGCCTNKTRTPPAKPALIAEDNCCSLGKNYQEAVSRCCPQGRSRSDGSESRVSIKPHLTGSPAINTDAIAVVNPVSRLPKSNFNELDIEKAIFTFEHMTVSVSGMTCTGCEKKLYRSLESFPAITNIKTSLLLAQAEFDLSGSTDSVELLKSLERMTGFTCAKMNQSGQVLDITLQGNAQAISEADLPYGVTDLEVLSESTIRVTYQPKLIGARDLLSDPSFPSGRLAPVADRPLIASGRAHVKDMLFKTVLSAVLTIPVLVMAWAPLQKRPVVYGAVSLALATAVQTYIAGPFYIGAIKALLFSRMIEMDLLIVISTTTAYIYSVIAYGFLAAGAPLFTGEFFETSTLLVTLIMVGRLVSAFARQKAVESISIESLQAPRALLVYPNYEEEIDARLLQYNDRFKVPPDAAIVTDGIVIFGQSEVDESMITGEATLVEKKPGSSVIAGSINYSGTLIVQLTRLPGENTISNIGTMVDEAKSSKPKIQHMADRVAGYFVPVILLITVLVFFIWLAIGKAVRHQSATNACITAMTYAISALIVSCPCAIGLAVPMVVVIAGGVAAKNGLIFKNAETIEIARNLAHVVFDKTGTLTQGLLSVEIEEYPEGNASLPASTLLSLTKDNKHPVSAAITAHLKNSGIEPSDSGLEAIVSVAGKGVQGKWNGHRIQAGNPYWLGAEENVSVCEAFQLGLSTFCVSLDDELVAVFGLRDRLRPDAADVIQQLHKLSINVSIVSGDNEESVKSIARSLNVPEANLRFKCSPEDKSHYVKSLLSPKKVIMFCGDGTNDAVALAQANIGMHINGGTDIAQSAADAVLVRPALKGILTLVNLSKAFYSRVVFNFAWSFVYNLFAILLAAGAFPHARIPPEFAGLGEIVSVLPVIAVALQLRWAKRE